MTIPETVTWPPVSNDDVIGMVEMLRRRVLSLEALVPAAVGELQAEQPLPVDEISEKFMDYQRRRRAREAGGRT